MSDDAAPEISLVYRWMCHKGHFLAESALHEEDYRDNGAYYGVSTRFTATCKACGLIENPRLVAIRKAGIV